MPTDDQIMQGDDPFGVASYAKMINIIKNPSHAFDEGFSLYRVSKLRDSSLLQEMLDKQGPTTVNDDGLCVYQNTDGTTVTVTESDRFGGWEALEADLQVLLGEVPKPTKEVEFTAPFKFERLEVPPPKPRHNQSDREDMAHSWYRMYGKHNAGKKPQRKTSKRQRQRFSLVLLAHYVATCNENFEYENTHWYWCSGMDQIEFQADFSDLEEELHYLEQSAAEWPEDCIPGWLIEAQTEIEIKMYERQQAFNARHKKAA